MDDPIFRARVEAFFAAYATRDAGKIAEFLHDDVEWTVSGPVDVLPFCGTYLGKANVLDLLRYRGPAVFRVFHFVPDAFLIDGDQAAALTRLSARHATDGRVISYRVANFFKFRDGLVIFNLSLLDSFDAVEQVIGHRLDVHDGDDANLANLANSTDLPELVNVGPLVAL